MAKRKDGRETWHRLVEWDKDQAASERLAAQILLQEKYESLDPSHPLGGRDGGKDIVCKKNDKKYVVGVYFPRGQKKLAEIAKKFKSDLKGVDKNKAAGLIFVTNQELTLGERESLEELTSHEVKIIHLEQMMMLLNAPLNYGLRLEYLDIEMTKEEQLSHMASKDGLILNLQNDIKQIVSLLKVPERKETDVSGVTVTATTVSYGAFSGKPFHKCSHCRYGFMVAGRDQNYYGVAVRFNPDVFTSVLSATTMSTDLVTCPKCGNVEECSRF